MPILSTVVRKGRVPGAALTTAMTASDTSCGNCCGLACEKLGKALESGALVQCLPEDVCRPIPEFLTFRPGARRVARIEAIVSLAEQLVPELLSN